MMKPLKVQSIENDWIVLNKESWSQNLVYTLA